MTLEYEVEDGLPQTISEFDPDRLKGRVVSTDAHCFGCTAGAGSSCGGAVVSE
jgi:hypothetical protein